jgi:hypothetical protein
MKLPVSKGVYYYLRVRGIPSLYVGSNQLIETQQSIENLITYFVHTQPNMFKQDTDGHIERLEETKEMLYRCKNKIEYMEECIYQLEQELIRDKKNDEHNELNQSKTICDKKECNHECWL